MRFLRTYPQLCNGRSRHERRRGCLDSCSRLRPVATLAVALLAACGQSPDQPLGPLNVPPSRQVAAAELPGSVIPGSVRLARVVPQFGGAYIDTSGVLNIALVDLPALKSAAVDQRQQLVSNELRSQGRSGLKFRFIPAHYTFQQLDTWRAAMSSLLGLDGVVFSEIAERENHIRVGVENASVETAISAGLDPLGIPRDAVVYDMAQSATPTASLSDKVRPLQGGTRIWTWKYPGWAWQCSAGVNAIRSGVRYMIISAHCSYDVQSHTWATGTNVYQGPQNGSGQGASSPYYIGTVTLNPPFTSGMYGCPIGAKCRYSDAALVQLASSVTYSLGGIARPAGGPAMLPSTFGTLTIGTPATIDLAGTTVGLYVGDFLSKIGATTGWTAGVLGALNRVQRGGDGFWRLGTGVVAAGDSIGDSGGPVMFESSQGEYFLAGTAWGSAYDQSSGQPVFLFSLWSNIDYELGTGLLPY